MRRLVIGTLALVGLVAPTRQLRAQASQDSAVAACERADSSAAWRRVGEAWHRANAGRIPRDSAHADVTGLP